MNANFFINYILFPKRLLFSATVCFVAVFSLTSFQSKKEISEPIIKALFLYNFTKYIEWPEQVLADHFVIGFYGPSIVTDELKQICANKNVKNKAIEIKIINTLDDVEKCQIVFVPKSHNGFLKKINELIEGKGVLIVTEEKGMAVKGASINIIEKEEKIRFELNEAAIKRAGLKVSDQLVTLAILIKAEKS